MKLIKNGTVLTAESEFKGDILIDGETIMAVGKNLDQLADDIIDASGKYIFPGGVDEHTHFGSFGGRLFETTEAAAVGGRKVILWEQQLKNMRLRPPAYPAWILVFIPW